MLLAAALSLPLATAAPLNERFGGGSKVVWAGLDYSTTDVFVPETFSDPSERIFWGPGGGLDDRITRFDSPEAAWVQLTIDWNAMFQNELLKKVEKSLDIDLVPELPEPDGQTQPRSKDWFRAASLANELPPTLTQADVVARTKAWVLTSTAGTGFGIVVERIAKLEDAGCVWPLFFDVASREVLYAERLCDAPAGMEFRNYWFNPLVDILKVALAKVKG